MNNIYITTLYTTVYTTCGNVVWFNAIRPLHQTAWNGMNNIIFLNYFLMRRPVTSAILCTHINDKLPEL